MCTERRRQEQEAPHGSDDCCPLGHSVQRSDAGVVKACRCLREPCDGASQMREESKWAERACSIRAHFPAQGTLDVAVSDVWQGAREELKMSTFPRAFFSDFSVRVSNRNVQRRIEVLRAVISRLSITSF